jgi:hypothetical protein
MGAADVGEGGRDEGAVLGMLVGQHHFRRRVRHTRLVAVDGVDFCRPLPAFIGKVEPISADAQRRATGQRLLDR